MQLASDVAGQVTTWMSTTLVGEIVAVVLIIVVALVARWLWHRFVRRTARALTGNYVGRRVVSTTPGVDADAFERYRARTDSVARLISSVGTFLIFATAVIVLLAQVGFNVAPLLASAGVAGLAIGFGAQTIIRDFLSGVFMLFENQYSIGDTITVSGITGTVENVGLRITQLRDVEGTIWYVTNGSVTELGNRSQGWSVAVVDVPVGYGADLDTVHDVLAATARELQQDPKFAASILSDEAQVAAESMTPMAVTFRVRLHTQPGQQLAVGRELRLRELAALEAAGIAAPSTTKSDENP